MRIGVIGAGFITELAIAGFQAADDVSVAAIAARKAPRAEALAAKFGIEHALDDHRALLAMDDIDLVYVATPPATHHALVLDVIAAGKHVLCEKQFAMTAAEAGDMLRRATAAGVVHAITHPSRYLPPYLAARGLVAAGFLGQTQLVRIGAFADFALKPNMPPYYASWSSRRAEGGGLRDYLCHHLDHVRYIFGGFDLVAATTLIAKASNALLAPGIDIRDVWAGAAQTAGSEPADAYDTAVVLGTLPGGGLLSVAAGWSLNHPAGVDWQMYGQDGVLRLRGAAFASEIEGAAAGEGDFRSMLAPDPPPTSPYTLLAADLRDAIADRSHVPAFATFHDGLELQKILDRIVEPAPPA
jgi:predicted dehydrogenase